MKVEIELVTLILFMFLYLLVAIVLLEIIYFESKLNEVIILLNHFIGK